MASVIYPGLQTFIDPLTGDVLANGTVTLYVPGTTVDKTTYADPNGDTENDNPIQLDANGQCAIWGTGLYRQIVKRSDGTQLWDRVTKVTPVTRPPVTVYALRGWNEDEADTDGDFIFANSLGRFDLTIPVTYTPGASFSMTFTGGVASEGTPPNDFETYIGIYVYCIQGGATSVDDGPFSDSGLSYAIGNTYVNFQPSTTASWTAIGDGAPLTVSNLGQSNIGGETLIDGTPRAPGEGSFVAGPIFPLGWWPRVANTQTEITPGTVNMEPGQIVNIQFFTQSLSYDTDNPTNSFYPYIRTITVNIGAETIDVPVTSIKTGFNIGAASVPWSGLTDVAPWNAFTTVSTTQPSQSGIQQDMWLIVAP